MEDIVSAFELYASSRSCYEKMREKLKFTSVRKLQTLTSKILEVNEIKFLKSVFDGIEDRQKLCIILQDEVYVKEMLLYSGGSIFGKARRWQKFISKNNARRYD